MKNNKALEAFIDEIAAVLDKKTLPDLYNIATSLPYSFPIC